MGKKDKSKNKKKISGIEKTALKIEKKLNARQKKEIAVLGEVGGFHFYFVFFESTRRKNESVNNLINRRE